jgi:hypothetical protein
MRISTPISVGELFDKISVLAVKKQKISSKEKLKHVAKEYDLLYPLYSKCIKRKPELKGTLRKLTSINENLWDVLETQRQMEEKGDLGEDFVTVSVNVYRKNDERFRLKEIINELTGSAIKEQKHYTTK